MATLRLPARPRLFLSCVLGMLLVDALRYLVALTGGREWYSGLDKSYLNPPLWVFGPVGVILYICTGIGLYLVLTADHDTAKRQALIAFSIQVVLGLIWPVVFFGLHWLWPSFGVSVALIIATILLMREGNSQHHAIVYILAPSLVWVTFISFLNLSVALLN